MTGHSRCTKGDWHLLRADLGTGPFDRGQIISRSLTLIIGGQIALAAIVIGFVANTWSDVSPAYRHFAFVVVCGSGAHFVMALALGGSCALAFHFCKTIRMTSVIILACAGYIYSSLIVQHSGLAHMLLESPWVSIFPLGQRMITLINGPDLEFYYYFLPAIVASSAALTFWLLLELGNRIIRRSGLVAAR